MKQFHLMKCYKIVLIFVFCYLSKLGNCQIIEVPVNNNNDTIAIELDSVVIYASDQEQLDVSAFIQYIQNDTTFYKAFKNLHFTTYNADNSIKILNKKNSTKASMISETKHIYRNKCRYMLTLDESVTGDYYTKKNRPKYYTASLYDAVFFTRDTVCNESPYIDKRNLEVQGNALEKHKSQLKQLMFNPGSKITGVPLMGNKAAMFNPGIRSMYNFKLTSDYYNNELVYKFEATPKPGMHNKVVYQLFKTWFRMSDLSIIAREYSLKYDATVYDFDVYIKVDLIQKNKLLVPKYIYYRGNWRAIGQGREIATFQTTFYH